jgi:hypothetical protein
MSEETSENPFHQQFILRWLSPSPGLHAALGRPGFALPSIMGLHWHSMPGDGSNNWLLSDHESVNLYHYDVDPRTSVGSLGI